MADEVYMHAGSKYCKTERDLTPDEARAEVEAFFGGEWTVIASYVVDDGDLHLVAERDGVCVDAYGSTYRAAVDALKQAWRDAVRPWMDAAIDAKLDTADVDGYAPNERVIARVCEKGMENA